MERPVRVVVAGFLGLWSMFSLGLVSIACAPAPNGARVRAEDRIEEGHKALRASRPDLARDDFADALIEAPTNPEAAFGLALSETLMLPASPAVRGTLADLRMRTPIVEEEVFGPTGILADLSRGLEADVVRRRALALLGLDRDDTPDLRALLAGADDGISLASLAARARELAAELAPIAGWFDAAAQPEFQMIVPGGLFHLDGDLIVGPGEAAALAGAVRIVRAGLQAVGAYRWQSAPLAEIARQPDVDLASTLSSVVWTAAPPRSLHAPANELRRGVDRLKEALGSSQQRVATPGAVVAWELLPRDGVDRVLALLEATSGALTGRTDLPDTEPATTLDLSAAAANPPALPIGSFEALTDGGVGLRHGFLPDLTRGFADPPIAFDPEPTPVLFAGGLPKADWLSRWLNPVVNRFQVDLGL